MVARVTHSHNNNAYAHYATHLWLKDFELHYIVYGEMPSRIGKTSNAQFQEAI
jgi:hypothetical protein